MFATNAGQTCAHEHDDGHGLAGCAAPACVPCPPPEMLEQVCEGERVWFSDSRITGVICRVAARAEITNRAMDVPAECMMLNKRAQILEAMCTLDDVLRRMQGHQAKKRPLKRAVTAWNLAGAR
jgi:hypothetical protein